MKASCLYYVFGGGEGSSNVSPLQIGLDHEVNKRSYVKASGFVRFERFFSN